MEINSQHAVLLVLLDLSTAFDIDCCEQSLIFLCKVTARETQARERRAAINEGVTREEIIRDRTADLFVLSGDNEAVKVI